MRSDWTKITMISILNRVADYCCCDLAVDLGSTNTVVYRKGAGIVVNEPTLVALDRSNLPRRVIHSGFPAKNLHGKQNDGLVLLKPVRYGVIRDQAAVREMLVRYLAAAARSRCFSRSFRVVANVPVCASPQEKERIRRAMVSAGARQAYLIEEPRAVALGAGMDISEERAVMVLDIGGGITEMAVVAEGKVVRASAMPVGGEHMDRAIAELIRKRYGLYIDGVSAEEIKISIGSASPPWENAGLNITGLDIKDGLPRTIRVTAQDVCEALVHTLDRIAIALKRFLLSLAPRHSVDILDRGIVLAGGSAMLRDIDLHLERKVLYPFFKVKEPLTCLARGAIGVLEYIDQID